ncbi:unnamed protein product [Lymnaea stagnalis]|uniref:Amino acid transporter transmembrane domain-containing protein n=1 Tax=Lymnaea stagnalis TaxID=6523 RepID=A0AAV2HEE0_LYMST
MSLSETHSNSNNHTVISVIQRSVHNFVKRNTEEPSLSVNDDNSYSEDESSHLLGKHTQHFPHHLRVNGNQDEDVHILYETLNTPAGQATHRQHSIITIFSMWNTMMGTSLLSMPWTIKQAGFINGIVLLVLMAGIMAYTSYRVLAVCRSSSGGSLVEFSDAVRIYLGRIVEGGALVCSILTLVGGCIVYWILMSNFLFHIGIFIYSKSNRLFVIAKTVYIFLFNDHKNKLISATCDNKTAIVVYNGNLFDKMWDETKTIPFYLVVLIFPIINLKSPTFFTKFNSFGTLFVIYLAVFVLVKAGQWGINIDLNIEHASSWKYSSAFEWTFPALTGVAALAYLLQNAVVSIVRNQKYPENNTRDLIIAYILVCSTYTVLGAVFYASFPLEKSCIEDNFLNNIASTDIMAFVARIGLFFQLLCVLPLLTFIIRAQLLNFIFQTSWPSFKHVLILNLLIVSISVVFAVFLPNIGHIIGFVGGFCGFSYAIALPCAVYLVSSYQNGSLTVLKSIFHSALILIGLANFLAQFVIIGHTK